MQAEAVTEHLLEQATQQHREGNFDAARGLYRDVLVRAPEHCIALFRSGLLELQQGNPAAALTLVQRAKPPPGDAPRYQFVIGQALQALRRWDEAVAAYHAALAGQPDFLDAWNNLGICRHLSRRLAEAADAYRHALTLAPSNAGIMANLGAVLRETGSLQEAIELLQRAASLEPATSSHAVNLGIAYQDQGRYLEAEQILNHALAGSPADADAAFNLGNALHALDRSRDAAERYRQAVALRPDFAEAYINLGNVLTDGGEFAAATAAYDAALRLQPNSVVALNNAGCLLRLLGRIEDAQALLNRALQLDPKNAALHDTLGNLYKDAGDLDGAIESFRAALAIDPNCAPTHSNLAYALSFQSTEPKPILEECLRWNQRFAAPAAASMRWPNELDPDRRLKIGYVSPDFRVHCQSLFMLPLLSQHDHAAFEVFCYSSAKRPDEYTRRTAAFADQWREVRPLNDAALGRRIQDDGIDILVDLTMHMAGGRPLLFARKSAPIQIAWLAYPGTTGIAAIDYRFSDPRLDPDGFDAHYSERTLRLPDSFWCYDPLSDLAVNALPAIERGYLTFGCLNNPCKISERTLALWGEVLRALPTSRLQLMAPPGRYRERLVQRLSAQGVGALRIEFRAFQPRNDYLRSYHDIDLGLDTFPYNGHTTSLDSQWMGVPVVTRIGNTSVGRGGLSQLFQLNLLELAAHSDAEFVAIATSLASDLTRLASLRATLRSRLAQSPLMDAARFARHIERAYRDVWQDYCGTRVR